MKDQFESAKRELEGILSREWSLRGSAPDERRSQLRQIYPDDTDAEIEDKLTWGNPYYFRKEAPEFRTRGTNQMILGLDQGYVGKTRLYIETSNHYVLYAIRIYEPDLGKTLEILEGLGFDVPEHHYVGIEHKDGNFKVEDGDFGFVIAHDLTENGKYRVEDVEGKHFETLSNGAELRQQLIDASRILQEIYDKKNPLYAGEVNGHVTDEGPQEAFRHMFFTQIDSTANTGKLVLGDLDHVILYRKPQAPSK
ncbi:MAG TPA: hypothetical protein VJB08_05470 [Candidatus Nanoarchaeia archaeon]|nr:hypothetical protein [Candidatus Nanoarchaeia archaeon]